MAEPWPSWSRRAAIFRHNRIFSLETLGLTKIYAVLGRVWISSRAGPGPGPSTTLIARLCYYLGASVRPIYGIWGGHDIPLSVGVHTFWCQIKTVRSKPPKPRSQTWPLYNIPESKRFIVTTKTQYYLYSRIRWASVVGS